MITITTDELVHLNDKHYSLFLGLSATKLEDENLLRLEGPTKLLQEANIILNTEGPNKNHPVLLAHLFRCEPPEQRDTPEQRNGWTTVSETGTLSN